MDGIVKNMDYPITLLQSSFPEKENPYSEGRMKDSLPPSARGMCAGILETMTITDVATFRPEVVVVPLGSTEPHGPHLPYGTDTFAASAVSEQAVIRANENGARVLRLPALPFGNNVNFKQFPFACRISVRTLMSVIGDMVNFVVEEGVRKMVFVNGHGGNAAAVDAAMREVFDRFQEEIFVCAVDTGVGAGETYQRLFKDGSPHAGDYETSQIMHLASDLVNRSAIAPQPMCEPLLHSLKDGSCSWVKAWHRLMPSSSGGRPDEASAEKGGEFFNECVRGFADFLLELNNAPWTPRFPYGSDATR